MTRQSLYQGLGIIYIFGMKTLVFFRLTPFYFKARESSFLSQCLTFHLSPQYRLQELTCVEIFRMCEVSLGDCQLFFLNPTLFPSPSLSLSMAKVSFQVPIFHRFPQIYFIRTGLAGMDLTPWLPITVSRSSWTFRSKTCFIA